MEPRILVVKDSLYKHKPWFDHPDAPERIQRALHGIIVNGLGYLVDYLEHMDPGSEAFDVALKIHCQGYVKYIEKLAASAPSEIDPDTYVTYDTIELALEVLLYTYKLPSKYSKEIILLRPPGHHAGKCGKAMGAPTQGFCILNNAAAAVTSLLDRGVEKIAVLDFDLHHGNGTQEIFYKTSRVLHVDIHRDPRHYYPFTGRPEQVGEGRGWGYSVNLIVGPKTGDDYYTELFEQAISLIRSYEPGHIVVSMGFDGYHGDGLGDTRLTQYTYNFIGLKVGELDIPYTMILEGGYSVGLEKGLPAMIKGLLGYKVKAKPTNTPYDIRLKYTRINNETIKMITEIWRNNA